MCGRFTQQFTWQELVALYQLNEPPHSNMQPRFNIAPTTYIFVVREREGTRDLVQARWGLVPGWWSKPLKAVPATFNARAESVSEKPMFRSAFKSRRCIIPASGYYEWQSGPDGKQPHYYSPAGGGVLSIAGLWEQWRDRETDAPVLSATMIVTAANAFAGQVHDRMPVFLAPEAIGPWLAGEAGTDALASAPEDLLRAWPVSRRLNRPGNDDDATLIEAVAA